MSREENILRNAGYSRLQAGLRSSHLPALDGIRAVAVFIVIFNHAGLPCPGGLGVLVFFVLSGFLITWLLLKEFDRYSHVSLKHFYMRRSLRIFPAFYAYAAFAISIELLLKKTHIVWTQVLCSLFYVNNYYQALYGDPNAMLAHTWSLAVEEQFYLLWPATFLFLQRKGFDLAKSLAGAIAFVWTYRLVLVFVVHAQHRYIYQAFDTRADSLMSGCLLAILLHQGRCVRLFDWICRRQTRAIAVLSAIVISVVIQFRFGPIYGDSLGLAINSVLVAAFIAQMIAWRDAAVGHWLNWRWISYLGVLSYSLYLYQQIAVHPAQRIAAKLPGIVRLPTMVVVILFFALASYYVVERPALHLKARFSDLPPHEPEADEISDPEPGLQNP